MKKLQLNKFLDYNYLADLQVSPSEKHLSFIVATANYDANNYNHHLYLSDGTKHQKVLDLNDEPFYVWEDDNNILYFNHKKKSDSALKELKQTVVYRYNLKQEKSGLAFVFNIPVSAMTILNNQEIMLKTSLSKHDHKLLKEGKVRQDYINNLNKETFYHIIEEVPFQSNGSGFIDEKRSQAFVFNTKKETYTPLVKDDVNFGISEFNEDKTILYFTAKKATQTPTFFSDIYKYNINTKKIEKIYDKQKVSVTKLIPLSNKLYVMGEDKSKFKINQNSDFYLLNENKLEKVLSFGLSNNNSIGSDVRYGTYIGQRVINNTFYFIGTTNDKTILYKFDGKEIIQVLNAKGSLETFISFNDTYYGIGLYNNNLSELYKLNLNSNSVDTISSFNKGNLKNTYIAKPIHHTFKNDGYTLDGWVLLPQDYNQNKKYPAILDIHGGPKTIYGDVFYHEMQVWANLGYIVFFTNPRGSDSFDDDFANIRGKYGTIDYDDLMAFTNFVIKEYSVDKTRLGVTGGSYGGFMTNWIVSHTDRFKAAATQRSITNWISFYGTSDIGAYFGPDQTAGNPLIDHDIVWEQSPLKHANNIKTPLLFIHSDKDYRCPIEQAMQLYTVVKMNGIDSRFVWFKDENHDLSRSGKPQARLLRLQEITNWLNKYLKD